MIEIVGNLKVKQINALLNLCHLISIRNDIDIEKL